MSIVIHDDHLSYFRNDAEMPLFTGVRPSIREAGQLVAELLLDIVEGKSEGAQTHLLEADLIVGRSTGPAHAA